MPAMKTPLRRSDMGREFVGFRVFQELLELEVDA
jgi:hypothetical protein